MRFLQSEWHRHERDRNAWEIERAEMKSKIGKMEGDGRTAKRLHETLGKHVKMLEIALKKEREKFKKIQAGEAASENGNDIKPAKEAPKTDLKGKPCRGVPAKPALTLRSSAQETVQARATRRSR